MKKENIPNKLFIKGPIDIELINRVNKLKVTDVLLTIWLQVSMEKSYVIHLKPSLFDKMGVDRSRRYRGIKKLEEAGILKVLEKKTGKAYSVELIKSSVGVFLPVPI